MTVTSARQGLIYLSNAWLRPSPSHSSRGPPLARAPCQHRRHHRRPRVSRLIRHRRAASSAASRVPPTAPPSSTRPRPRPSSGGACWATLPRDRARPPEWHPPSSSLSASRPMMEPSGGPRRRPLVAYDSRPSTAAPTVLLAPSEQQQRCTPISSDALDSQWCHRAGRRLSSWSHRNYLFSSSHALLLPAQSGVARAFLPTF
ncbi:hypothetical protein JB92DRAFT_420976 [Gautieria morchelliformis]|nr:hypothetical protein JB92DRAFT_420976 [Gautieria morchelliformis]